ncbi:MAG TPA: CoA transferase [Vicinamibacterales bacterium]|nr:CoA transferase [Vicinamibacterales bacterium]
MTQGLPLAGLRVLDLTRVVAGPLCTMLLGDMGAEVIKIEDPHEGDETRGWAPFVEGWSTYFLSINRNKKSVAVDLKSDEGRALMTRLVQTSDVLVENFRPGTVDRLGFGPEQARALNERLIYCSISGYGATGPRSGESGYDLVIQAESGLMDVTGHPETGPTKVGVAIADCLAALYAVQGILLAHIARLRTGRGQVVDISLLDSAVSVLGMPAGIVAATGRGPGLLGNRHPSLAPYAPFPVSDGLVVVAVPNARLWSRFCAAIGAEALERDPQYATNSARLENRESLDGELRKRLATETVDSLIAKLTEAGVPCGRVRSIEEVLADPQLAARGMLLALQAGAVTVTMPGNPIRLSEAPELPLSQPPALGAHTQEVRQALLGEPE